MIENGPHHLDSWIARAGSLLLACAAREHSASRTISARRREKVTRHTAPTMFVNGLA
jgi:hypothetical protein